MMAITAINNIVIINIVRRRSEVPVLFSAGGAGLSSITSTRMVFLPRSRLGDDDIGEP